MGNQGRTFERFRLLNDVTPSPVYLPIEDLELRYYIRLLLADQPGVVARVAQVFGNHGISLRAFTQHETEDRPDDGTVPVMVLTHIAREGQMRQALAKIAELEVVKSAPVTIRVVEEHVEYPS